MIKLVLHNAATRADGSPWPSRWRRERSVECRTEAEARSRGEAIVRSGEAQRVTYTIHRRGETESETHAHDRRGWRVKLGTGVRFANRPDRKAGA